MSISNLKRILIDKTSTPKSNFFLFEHELYWLANTHLNQSGMTMYMFFMSLVPDSIDHQLNLKNTRTKPYELYSSKVAEIIHKDTKTVQRGINDLIKNGYLIERSPNLYQFIDIIPEDHIMTTKDFNQIQDYEILLRQSLTNLEDEKQLQLKQKAKENLEKLDWETEEEWKIRVQTI